MIFTEKCLIRFARAEDYRKVEEIMKQVQALHVQWRPDIYKAADPVWTEEDFLSEVNKETVIVAELSGNVVALLSIMYRHITSDTQVTRDVLFIDSMGVDEPFRGKGIGHQLFDFVRELAREKKCDGIALQVNARNAAAVRCIISMDLRNSPSIWSCFHECWRISDCVKNPICEDNIMVEKVEFTNMCMICDKNKVVVIDRKRWIGQALPFLAVMWNRESHFIYGCGDS